MKAGLTTRMLAASGVLAVIVAGAFAVLVVAIGSFGGSARSARHSEEVIATANNLEKLVLDLETGSRGFVITADRKFLEPWTSARRAIPGKEAKLERLVSDNPHQERLARRIHSTLDSYVNDWSAPLIRRAAVDRVEGGDIVATGTGKKQVDAMRVQFGRFVHTEQLLGDARRHRADVAGRRATMVGIGGLGGSILLILLFAGYLVRAIVVPVRRVAGAAGRLAGGDLSARVPEGGSGEVRQLGEAFNAMGASLQESHDELESQNTELELQTAELEDQQSLLSSANDELQAQQGELERAVAELGEEKERVEEFYEFGAHLAAQTEVEPLTEVALSDLGEIARAEIGTLYARSDEQEETFSLHAARALDRRVLTPELHPGVGLAGRALAECRTVAASHGETGLRVEAFGREVALAHELHLPLCHGGRMLGVVTLGRLADRPFSAGEVETLEHLAGQTAVALSNALSFSAARRLAGINGAVLDAATDTIVMVDLDGRVVLANEATHEVAKAHGVSPEGDYLDLTAAIRERTTDPEAYWATVEAIMADPEHESVTEYELAESGRSFQRYTAPVRDGDGALLGRILTIREVTAEREAERLKSELVATVSHELRTPLASILGFAELLVERDVDAATGKRYLETIHNEARRLTSLINDFLDLQRIEEGGFRLALEPFALDELVREQVELFSAQSFEHALEVDLPAEPITVLGERDRMVQVLGNLLSNAVKYSPAGGRVQVVAAVENGAVRVSVADTGLGIPADEQRNVFKKFFRVDTSDTREIGGTGLGLAVCREIVQAHGGRIGFDSVEGEGSTFWFELPHGRARQPAGVRRILVIEDDPAAASLLADALDWDGYAVEVTASGEDALARAEREPPSLICLDIGLAGELDGWEVLSRLKANPATTRLPVVVCTAGNGREQAATLGAADFLTKPFTARLLRETVARLLPSGRGSVLVVDDEEAVRTLVLETLGGNGFELREAADGEEALAEIAARRPDALVLDLVMPKLDGFGVLERLQADPSLRSMPVLVLTARRLSRDERRSLSAHAVAVLEKSDWSGDELRSLIERTLGE